MSSDELNLYLEKVAGLFIKELFGDNVNLITKFHFFAIEKEEQDTDPEYYISKKFRHFDFWYDPRQDVVSQPAYGIADFYLKTSGSPEGDVFEPYYQLLSFYENIKAELQ